MARQTDSCLDILYLAWLVCEAIHQHTSRLPQGAEGTTKDPKVHDHSSVPLRAPEMECPVPGLS